MTRMTHAQALAEALIGEMRTDPAISLIGSYVFGLGPSRVQMDRIRQEFGARVFDPPSAEAAIVMLATGAALAGGRPFVSIGTAAFSLVAWSALVNEAANVHYQSGGRSRAPAVFHMLHGVRAGAAPQHATSPQAQLWNNPGLEIVLPASPADAKGLLTTALRSPNPTVFIDHPRYLEVEGEVPDGDHALPFGNGRLFREGRDVTIVATSWMVKVALDAAQILANEGIEAEVFDPRTLVPFDDEGLFASIERTGRLVVVDECVINTSVASEIAARVAEHRFDALRAPIARVARPAAPAPFSAPLERLFVPSAERITEAVRGLMTWPKG
jgi:acetoin:2,6-dichlorophenolindophenol oxidoreductase subunit beta